MGAEGEGGFANGMQTVGLTEKLCKEEVLSSMVTFKGWKWFVLIVSI